MTGLRERKRAQTAAAIEAEGLRLFASKGYADTTVDDIAAAAEVSRATAFRYFAAKEDILFAGDATDGERLVEIARRHGPSTGSFEARVRAAVLEFAAYLDGEAQDRLWLRWDIASGDDRMLGRAIVAYARWSESLARTLGGDGDFGRHVTATGAIAGLYEAVRRCHRSREALVPLVTAALDQLGIG